MAKSLGPRDMSRLFYLENSEIDDLCAEHLSKCEMPQLNELSLPAC